METIEQRAEKRYKLRAWMNKSVQESVKFSKFMFIEIATDQDRISRADERERCIQLAREWYCKKVCVMEARGICDPRCREKIESELIKAMEDDGNE